MTLLDISFCNRSLAGFVCLLLGLIFVERVMTDEPAGGLAPQVQQALFQSEDHETPSGSNPRKLQVVPTAPSHPDTQPGEDVGSPGEKNSLLIIELQMQQLTERLQQLSTAPDMQIGVMQRLQFDLIRRLTEVIEQTEQSTPQVVANPTAEGAAGQEAGIGVTPAVAQNSSSDPENPSPVNAAQREAMLWNRLPLKVKTQLRDAAARPFLARYEELIEQFYNRLTEQR